MTPLEHLPIELLRTFTCIVKLDGDAAAAAAQLRISQPSISKRLTALRRETTGTDRPPWLILKGRRWLLSPEGERVYRVVADLVRQYEQMMEYIAGSRPQKSVVTLACGQSAALGFVRTAVQQFLHHGPTCQVRLSMPRGQARIEGVAGGQFDLAIVTDGPATIATIARREMFIQDLYADSLLLAGHPPASAAWAKTWHALPTGRPVTAAHVIDFPFLLPEPDATRRKQFDEWCLQATGRTVNVVLETGGWHAILDYVNEGLGVGLVSASAVTAYREQRPNSKLSVRSLDPKTFPADSVRLIARKLHGRDEPDLTAPAARLQQYLCSAARDGSR